jgi:urease accessory protein
MGTTITATTITVITITMIEGLAKLLAWLSPSFPVGAFSYSHGLEWAVEAGDIVDRPSLESWLADVLEHGAGCADAIFLAHAHRAVLAQDDAALREVAELAAAFQPTKERALESHSQGAAFLATVAAAWSAPGLDRLRAAWDGPVAYPVAVGVAAAAHGIDEALAVEGYLHGFASNLISAAVRLVPLGQTDGQRALSGAEARIRTIAARARQLGLDDAGGATLRSDIASMRHETQYTRLFRS